MNTQNSIESVLIDEKELVQRLVKEMKERNENMAAYLQKKNKEMGFRPYSGGVMTVPCSEDMTIDEIFKNLLAVFNNNFSASVFFQCDNIRMRHIVEFVDGYLTDRGLENDYLKYKQEHENKQQSKTQQS